jgi:hypothetical protein
MACFYSSRDELRCFWLQSGHPQATSARPVCPICFTKTFTQIWRVAIVVSTRRRFATMISRPKLQFIITEVPTPGFYSSVSRNHKFDTTASLVKRFWRHNPGEIDFANLRPQDRHQPLRQHLVLRWKLTGIQLWIKKPRSGSPKFIFRD